MLRSNRKLDLNNSFDNLSQTENDFLVTRLDPFHDTQYNPTGGPGSAPTVVRLYRRTATFSGYPASARNWSLCVGNMPNGSLLTTETTGLTGIAPNSCAMFNRCWDKGAGNVQRFEYDVSREYGGINTPIGYAPSSLASSRGTIYPLCPIFAMSTDQPVWQSSTTVNITDTANPVIAPATSYGNNMYIAQFGENVYLDGPSRLVAVAFEIHMTSSDLYNQGTLTIARVPQALQQGAIRFAQSANTQTNTVSTSSAVLPSNSGELLLFNGARQWPAKYGAYAVAPQSNEFQEDFDPCPFVNHTTRTLSWAANRALPTNVYAISNNASARNAETYLSSTESFDSIMVMLEGLHPNAVITVTTILTYETIPTDSVALRPLARMPQRMRPSLQEQYAKICQSMEPFCMVGENGSGAFFKKLKSVARSVIRSAPIASEALSLVPHPMAQSASKAINKAVKKEKQVQQTVKQVAQMVKPLSKAAKELVNTRRGRPTPRKPKGGQFTSPRPRSK